MRCCTATASSRPLPRTDGRIFKLDAHIERGFRSMAAIALEPPCDRQTMRSLIVETVRRNGLADAYIKWIVTRGSNGRPLMDPTGCVAEPDHPRAAATSNA